MNLLTWVLLIVSIVIILASVLFAILEWAKKSRTGIILTGWLWICLAYSAFVSLLELFK